jgi:hypothetical protein
MTGIWRTSTLPYRLLRIVSRMPDPLSPFPSREGTVYHSPLAYLLKATKQRELHKLTATTAGLSPTSSRREALLQDSTSTYPGRAKV